MKEVTLYNLRGVCAIIIAKSGVLYTNQVGGHSCMRCSEEGILIPFNNDIDEEIERRLSVELLNANYLNEFNAQNLDAILASSIETKCATVDRSRLRDSMEAWVYVRIAENTSDTGRLFKNFGESRAVLTWNNSD